jgi:hypothetical protein
MNKECINLLEKIKENKPYSLNNCMIFTDGSLKELTKTCIYGWKNETEWLYIGMSVTRIFRVINHDRTQDFTNIEDSDHIFLWFLPNTSKKDLREIEKELIYLLKPKYNKTRFIPDSLK